MDRQVREILDFWRSSLDRMPRNPDVLIIEAKLDVEYLASRLAAAGAGNDGGRVIRVDGEELFPEGDGHAAEPDPDGEDVVDLGPCCSCGGVHQVRNIIMLDVKGPVPGRGWGCVQCGLPCDGAVAMICDACLADAGAEIKEVCDGYPGAGKRVSRETLTEPFDHDLSKHPELREEGGGLGIVPGVCMVCGCTDDHACEGGCHWVEEGLCSRCAEELDLI